MTNKYLLRSLNSGIFILLSMTLVLFAVSCDSSDNTSKKSQRTPVTGPIIDMNIQGSIMDKLDLSDQSPESLAILGDRYFESGRFIQAIDVYRKAIELDPGDADTYNDLGLSLYYTGQPDEAVEILRKGTEIAPSYQNTWLSLGFIFAQTTKNDEAKTALLKAVEIDPNSPQGLEAIRVLQMLN